MIGHSELQVEKHVVESVTWYVVTFDPRTLSPLAKAIARAGRDVDGYAAEAILVRLAEIGEPVWADELTFDSEAEVCTVRCMWKVPLMRLLKRLEMSLAEPARLRRLVRSLPEG